MKALPVAIAVAIVAVPLFASAADDQTSKSSVSVKTLSVAPAPVEDSPLVRAAKATGRLGKKPGFVITNEMLVKSGGHITTTTASVPLPLPQTTPAVKPRANAGAVSGKQLEIEKAKKAEELKKARAARRAAADLYGDSIEQQSDDAAVQEHAMQQATSTAAATSTQAPAQPSKPPL